MSPSVVVTENPAALPAVTYLTLLPKGKLVALWPVAIGAGLIVHNALRLPWSLVIVPGAGLVVGAVLLTVYVGRRFPKTWWFRSDSIHIQRGPVTRHIQWELINRWQLTPVSASPGVYFLTVWHGLKGDDQTNSLTVPSAAAAEQIEQLLAGYERAV